MGTHTSGTDELRITHSAANHQSVRRHNRRPVMADPFDGLFTGVFQELGRVELSKHAAQVAETAWIANAAALWSTLLHHRRECAAGRPGTSAWRELINSFCDARPHGFMPAAALTRVEQLVSVELDRRFSREETAPSGAGKADDGTAAADGSSCAQNAFANLKRSSPADAPPWPRYKRSAVVEERTSTATRAVGIGQKLYYNRERRDVFRFYPSLGSQAREALTIAHWQQYSRPAAFLKRIQKRGGLDERVRVFLRGPARSPHLAADPCKLADQEQATKLIEETAALSQEITAAVQQAQSDRAVARTPAKIRDFQLVLLPGQPNGVTYDEEPFAFGLQYGTSKDLKSSNVSRVQQMEAVIEQLAKVSRALELVMDSLKAFEGQVAAAAKVAEEVAESAERTASAAIATSAASAVSGAAAASDSDAEGIAARKAQRKAERRAKRKARRKAQREPAAADSSAEVAADLRTEDSADKAERKAKRKANRKAERKAKHKAERKAERKAKRKADLATITTACGAESADASALNADADAPHADESTMRAHTASASADVSALIADAPRADESAMRAHAASASADSSVPIADAPHADESAIRAHAVSARADASAPIADAPRTVESAMCARTSSATSMDAPSTEHFQPVSLRHAPIPLPPSPHRLTNPPSSRTDWSSCLMRTDQS